MTDVQLDTTSEEIPDLTEDNTLDSAADGEAYVGDDCLGVDECVSELSPGACLEAACMEGACVLVAVENGTGCPIPPCAQSAACLGGLCIGLPMDCDDGNPCTLDFCKEDIGLCQHAQANNPCDDGDDCTTDDWCLAGVCSGLPVVCAPGHECVEGSCICNEQCGLQECGENPCGESCGLCPDGQSCEAGICERASYPPGPYGPFEGDTLPDQEFLDPGTLDLRHTSEFHWEGRLLLITYNAGWCIVCQEDTAVLNNWTADWHDDGLRILSILYEMPDSTPINQGYAEWWVDFYNVTYALWMDQPETGGDGKAMGGALGYYVWPAGPVPDNVMPVTMLVCPPTMEILYISQGFYDDIVTPLVEHYLFDVDCW